MASLLDTIRPDKRQRLIELIRGTEKAFNKKCRHGIKRNNPLPPYLAADKKFLSQSFLRMIKVTKTSTLEEYKKKLPRYQKRILRGVVKRGMRMLMDLSIEIKEISRSKKKWNKGPSSNTRTKKMEHEDHVEAN